MLLCLTNLPKVESLGLKAQTLSRKSSDWKCLVQHISVSDYKNTVEFDVLRWEIEDGGLLENKQAGWLGSGQTTRPVTNSTG